MLFSEMVQSECSKEVCSSEELHLVVYMFYKLIQAV